MAVTDFETKVAVVVRDDLAVWERLNVCAFLVSGVAAAAGAEAIGARYEDADGRTYLPLLVQPVLVFAAPDVDKTRTVRDRAQRRGLPFPIYTREVFPTGRDPATRAAVGAVATCDRDLCGASLPEDQGDPGA